MELNIVSNITLEAYSFASSLFILKQFSDTVSRACFVTSRGIGLLASKHSQIASNKLVCSFCALVRACLPSEVSKCFKVLFIVLLLIVLSCSSMFLLK